LRLAVEAGVWSRFRRDARIGESVFKRLYQNWILGSLRGELADVVLIADPLGDSREPVGLITISVTRGQGSIGLLAVDQHARGRGIGAALIETAHRWLADHGVYLVQVATQLENQAACRLYERCGYEIAERRNRYHFWL
jgi:dTDP-4-amino-4,6-dideoxy-D-galactose acyltransferase